MQRASAAPVSFLVLALERERVREIVTSLLCALSTWPAKPRGSSRRPCRNGAACLSGPRRSRIALQNHVPQRAPSLQPCLWPASEVLLVVRESLSYLDSATSRMKRATSSAWDDGKGSRLRTELALRLDLLLCPGKRCAVVLLRLWRCDHLSSSGVCRCRVNYCWKQTRPHSRYLW